MLTRLLYPSNLWPLLKGLIGGAILLAIAAIACGIAWLVGTFLLP